MNEADHQEEQPSEDLQKVDARILGRLLAAQNVVFALPDTLRIAEFYSQVLMTIPGITACRVCLGGSSVLAGEMAGDVCPACETVSHLAQEDGTLIPTHLDFKCHLADQPGMRGIAVAADQHHFGFFVIQIDQATFLELYHSFISNLSSYVALILENRRQKDLLQKANDELERKIEARTHELTAADEELAAYREHLEELVRKRTAELETRTAELKRMNDLFVGRELRMIELKCRIKELESKSGRSAAKNDDDED